MFWRNFVLLYIIGSKLFGRKRIRIRRCEIFEIGAYGARGRVRFVFTYFIGYGCIDVFIVI